MSINRCNISGNLAREPELRCTAAGTSILTFTVGVNDRKKNPQTQQWEDVPNWIPCVVFGQRAQTLSNFLTKGMKVSIEGKLRWSQWEKDGSKRSKIEVIVDEIEFMSQYKARDGQQTQQSNNYTNQQQSAPNSAPRQPQTSYEQQDVYDSEIPF